MPSHGQSFSIFICTLPTLLDVIEDFRLAQTLEDEWDLSKTGGCIWIITLSILYLVTFDTVEIVTKLEQCKAITVFCLQFFVIYFVCFVLWPTSPTPPSGGTQQ